MRILMVHKYFHRFDGVGTYIHRLATLLEESGHTVAPFAMHDSRNDRTAWERFFVSAGETRTLARGLGAVRQLRRAYWHHETEERFAAMLAAFAPDVIHVHNWYTHLSPSFLRVAERAGIPVIMTAHDFGFLTADYGLVGGRRYIKNSVLATAVSEGVARWHRLRGHHLRGVRAVICLSHYVAEVCRAYGVPEHLLRVIPPALPETVYDDEPAPQHVRQGVVFTGRLESYKGVEDVLQMADGAPNVPFTLIGDGPLRAMVEREAERRRNVTFLGWQPEDHVRRSMRAACIAVVPSRWAEPFGLVALEAQAAGAVTFVSDRGGLPEIIEDGRTGFVLPARMPSVWAKKIQDLLEKPRQCQQMSAAAEERGLALGNPETFLATMLSTYTEVCQQEPLPSHNILKW